jgi:hypothetical protein
MAKDSLDGLTHKVVILAIMLKTIERRTFAPQRVVRRANTMVYDLETTISTHLEDNGSATLE